MTADTRHKACEPNQYSWSRALGTVLGRLSPNVSLKGCLRKRTGPKQIGRRHHPGTGLLVVCYSTSFSLQGRVTKSFEYVSCTRGVANLSAWVDKLSRVRRGECKMGISLARPEEETLRCAELMYAGPYTFFCSRYIKGCYKEYHKLILQWLL